MGLCISSEPASWHTHLQEPLVSTDRGARWEMRCAPLCEVLASQKPLTQEGVSRCEERWLGFDWCGLGLSGLVILHCALYAPLGQRAHQYLEELRGGHVELTLPPHCAHLLFSEISSTAWPWRFTITMMCVIHHQLGARCCQLEQTQMLRYFNQLEQYRNKSSVSCMFHNEGTQLSAQGIPLQPTTAQATHETQHVQPTVTVTDRPCHDPVEG